MNKVIAAELHKPVKRKFKRAKVITRGIDDIWACDLVDMSAYYRVNKGFRFLLTIIDCFSRYAWAIPLKNKQGATILAAFKELFKEGRQPNNLWIDQGTEFLNKHFKTWLSEHKIKVYHTYSEHKASMIERFNRTLKTWMWRLFTENNNKKWLDILPSLLEEYNHRKHRSINMTPVDASKTENEKELWHFQYDKLLQKVKQNTKIKVGDFVRISVVKKTFEKGYIHNWSKEIFFVYAKRSGNPPMFSLKDLKGEIIEGSFYDEELQKTSEIPEDLQ